MTNYTLTHLFVDLIQAVVLATAYLVVLMVGASVVHAFIRGSR